MTTKTLHPADLAGFTGTEHWYRHPLVRSVLYTDGAKHVAEHGGAYWLLDEIAFAQHRGGGLTHEPFQVWTLTVSPDRTATLVCDDGNGRELYVRTLEFTDFPLPSIKLYFTDAVILLPSEY